MKIRLDCPHAVTGPKMRVYCRKTDGLCAFQYFKSCKGWWVNSPGADGCRLRRQPEQEGEN